MKKIIGICLLLAACGGQGDKADTNRTLITKYSSDLVKYEKDLNECQVVLEKNKMDARCVQIASIKMAMDSIKKNEEEKDKEYKKKLALEALQIENAQKELSRLQLEKDEEEKRIRNKKIQDYLQYFQVYGGLVPEQYDKDKLINCQKEAQKKQLSDCTAYAISYEYAKARENEASYYELFNNSSNWNNAMLEQRFKFYKSCQGESFDSYSQREAYPNVSKHREIYMRAIANNSPFEMFDLDKHDKYFTICQALFDNYKLNLEKYKKMGSLNRFKMFLDKKCNRTDFDPVLVCKDLSRAENLANVDLKKEFKENKDLALIQYQRCLKENEHFLTKKDFYLENGMEYETTYTDPTRCRSIYELWKEGFFQ